MEGTSSPKKKRLSLSLKSKKRFSEVSEAELIDCKKRPISRNSKRAHEWAVHVFEAWLKKEKCGELSDLWCEDKDKLVVCCANLQLKHVKPTVNHTLQRLFYNF